MGFGTVGQRAVGQRAMGLCAVGQYLLGAVVETRGLPSPARLCMD